MSALHFRTFDPKSGPVEQRCLIVHGIMGSSQNWLGATRRLRRLFPQWSFKLVDLPGHGDSSASVSEPDLPTIARTIHNDLEQVDWTPTVLVGHSFGGKTVLELSKTYHESPLSIWLLDAPIGADVTVTGSDTIRSILDVVDDIPKPTSREVVLTHFLEAGLPGSIGQWMTTNVRRLTDGFEWKISPNFVRSALVDYLERDYWSAVEDPNSAHRFYLVLAGRSDWWRGGIERRLRKLSQVQLFPLARSGHWVHIDDLEGLVNCFQRVY